ncbi:hypothetical protein B723_16530 [Pseudomonas fluorescens NCIMB 11764]|uniref:Uncharacterized protein n=1 Tax=Pseudomonas fluorescens NCIMB 11764 TaxID=1221522 RepID=A0A0K1QQ93_PSEFL|nr:hypothetical protein [Pseudomonas fluorescens]AKV07934.1 hypothetical protein B723_16530 [Pseudomonas fluorescens NCIMB 11764]
MFESLASEVIAAIVGGIFVAIYKDFLYPLFIEKTQEDTKLEPFYSGVLTWAESGEQEISLNLKKLGHKVTGAIFFKGKEYKIVGRYNKEFLTFTFFSEEKSVTSQGAGTFLRRLEGKNLEGYLTYRHFRSGSEIIDAIACDFKAKS